jgi:tetratricopeptide (TPR) repeat protein
VIQKYIALVVLMCFGSVGISQNFTEIGKIKRAISRAKEKDQTKLLSDLAWEYRAAFPDSTIYYALKSYGLAQKLNDKKNLARPLNFIGLAYFHKGNHLDAFDYFNQALKVAEAQRDSLQLAHACNNIGRLFLEQGLLPKSHTYLSRASLIFTSLQDSSGLAYSFQSLATYYKINKDVVNAEKYYKQAYSIRIVRGDTKEIISAMIQLGKLYLDNQRNNEALHYFQQADSADIVIKDAIIVAEIKTLTAQCLMNTGELERAEKMVAEGLRFIKNSQNMRLLPGAYLTMGQIQFKKGNLFKAKENFNLAIQISTLRKDLNTRMEAYFFLWQSFKQEGRMTEVLDNYTQYITLKDSIQSLEGIRQQERFQFEMEITKREQENEILKVKADRRIAFIVVLIVMVLSALVVLYLQLRNRRRILRVNHLLEDRNREIKKINTILNVKNTALENHMNTLIGFSKNRSIAVGNLAHAARDIVMATAKNLSVSQVSIWVYDDKKKCIETIACYNLEKNSHINTITLRFDEAPQYFEALKKERMIVAEDARTHHYTKEFGDSYFVQQNIYSLLDATFFLDGHLKGLVCCEHQNEIRKWTTEDLVFVSSVADVISLAFRTSQRLDYEHRIKQHNKEIAHINEGLEQRVKQRTEELEIQNKRLVEYAFINSHLLRGPLSRILGLINLMEHDHTMKDSEMLDLLRKSGDELDQVVGKISNALNDGNYVTRKDIE